MALRALRRYVLVASGALALAGGSLAACSGDTSVTTSGASSGATTGTGGSGGGTTTATGVGGGTTTSTTGTGGSGGSGGMPVGSFDCSAPTGDAPALKLTPVANGFKRPVLVKPAPDNDARLYVVSQAGTISILENGVLAPEPFLDISAKVFQPSGGDERGLLGLAFHPGYAQNGRFFVYYTDKNNGNQVLEEYARSDDPLKAKPTPTQTLFSQQDPEANHNGGGLEFSPKDGLLYIGMGDGGGAGDKHGAFGNGQNLATRWGKLLRIDVTPVPYTIPAGNITQVPPGNPTQGAVVPEIWDYGLRNPWRFTFDACTGDLYIADVGQGEIEEIDVEPAGQGNKNYGWRLMEGSQCYNPMDCDKTGITLPTVEYDHTVGCSVTGGYVYRGSKIPGLRGTYFYGDFCSGRIWTIRWSNGTATAPVEVASLKMAKNTLGSFGQGNDGEIYVVGLDGSLFRIDPQ